MDLNLATCLFTGLSTDYLQGKQYDNEEGRFTTANKQVIFAKDVVKFVRRKELRRIPNPLEISEEYFKYVFRLDRWLYQDFLLILCLRTYYRPETDTNRIPFDLRVLATLSYLAHGHFEALKPLAAFRGLTQNMLLFCVPQVCQKIVHFMATDFVSFPSNNDETIDIKNGFRTKYGIPHVVGVMDCFHVRIANVAERRQKTFQCRHGNLSINVQVICDHEHRFLNVNPRAPGGSSDIFVWRRSHIRGIMKSLFSKDPAWLIADRGYKLEDILINPYRNPKSPPELYFNEVVAGILNGLDTAVVMLTSRFRCLKTILPYDHQAAANIVTTCVTIHNYLLSKGSLMDEHVMSNVPKRKPLPNAYSEDVWSTGYKNRECIKRYLEENN
ncbi:putative nuclease HARBI1 [Ceratitis capitata]|uniref:Putative nuclease HARBI1 n=1 Tax=Ceratitis capitata TaxID=7213 RepID=W8BRA4_CERCA|nr:putative nuclease HARBI1 [Ceratitis capitata]